MAGYISTLVVPCFISSGVLDSSDLLLSYPLITNTTQHNNIILILMSLEIMLNACGLAFIVAGAHWGIADGQIMFMLILSIAAAEVSVGLGLLLQVHRRFGSLDIDQASRMRG